MLFPISIGNNCRPRYQIDRFMSNQFKNYKPTSFFFDSLMMGGLSGVINIIKREFQIKKEDIYIYEENGKFMPRDKSSGMAFIHDFGCKHSSWGSYDECENALNSAIHESLSKYSYLGQKTSEIFASNLKIGLVYFGADSKDNFEELNSVLKSRYQRKFFIINVLETPLNEPKIESDSICNVFVEDSKSPKIGTKQEWQGWDESWSKALSVALSK